VYLGCFIVCVVLSICVWVCMCLCMYVLCTNKEFLIFTLLTMTSRALVHALWYRLTVLTAEQWYISSHVFCSLRISNTGLLFGESINLLNHSFQLPPATVGRPYKAGNLKFSILRVTYLNQQLSWIKIHLPLYSPIWSIQFHVFCGILY
jgi:hypothetical protein